jgi:transcriptional regulator with XRE-family HTH domain
MSDLWGAQREALGAFIREQRKKANLSLRQLAELTSLSNPYLSQVERGLHQPSVRVLKAISDALNLSAETLLAQAGLIDAMADATQVGLDGQASQDGQAAPDAEAEGARNQAKAKAPQTEDAVRADPRLTPDQKVALIAVYRSMLGTLPGDPGNPEAP